MIEKEYIIPREKPNKKNKLPPETIQTNLARRLEEYIEYAHHCRHFSDVAFYEELLEYIEPSTTKTE
jgi:hypothetical protein